MSIIQCDTKGIEQIATEFTSLVNQYNQEVINIFELIASIPDKAWVGEDSNRYVAARLKHKTEFERLGNELRSYAQKLESSEAALNRVIGQVKR